MFVFCEDEGPAGTAHRGIDHTEVHRARRKIAVVLGDKETRLFHVLGCNLVGNIDSVSHVG